jgi:hypothetical protein
MCCPSFETRLDPRQSTLTWKQNGCHNPGLLLAFGALLGLSGAGCQYSGTWSGQASGGVFVWKETPYLGFWVALFAWACVGILSAYLWVPVVRHRITDYRRYRTRGWGGDGAFVTILALLTVPSIGGVLLLFSWHTAVLTPTYVEKGAVRIAWADVESCEITRDVTPVSRDKKFVSDSGVWRYEILDERLRMGAKDGREVVLPLAHSDPGFGDPVKRVVSDVFNVLLFINEEYSVPSNERLALKRELLKRLPQAVRNQAAAQSW